MGTEQAQYTLAERPRPETPSDDWYIGSVDQGTTSTRFIIFDRYSNIIASHQLGFDNHYPESG